MIGFVMFDTLSSFLPFAKFSFPNSSVSSYKIMISNYLDECVSTLIQIKLYSWAPFICFIAVMPLENVFGR